MLKILLAVIISMQINGQSYHIKKRVPMPVSTPIELVELPPDFKIITDGEHYTWKTGDCMGCVCPVEYGSIHEASDAAWDYYNNFYWYEVKWGEI